MKKLIIILALCFFSLPLFAYAENLGNATDKIFYCSNENIIQYVPDTGLYILVYIDGESSGGSDYYYPSPVSISDMASQIGFDFGDEPPAGRYTGQIIFTSTEDAYTTNCANDVDPVENYENCIIALDNIDADYYTNTITLDYSNNCSAIIVMGSVMDKVIYFTTSLIVKVFSTYWPFILVFSIIAGLIGIFIKFTKLGIR